MSSEQMPQNKDQLSMMNVFNESVKDLQEGTVIKGRIVEITNDSVLVDIGIKSEGIIPLGEFTKKGKIDINVGEEIEVCLRRKEGKSGHPVISFQDAVETRAREKIEEIFNEKLSIEAEVMKKIKGGFLVDIGEEAFMPASQAYTGRVKDADELIGKIFKVRITEFNPRNGNIVVSHRLLLDEEKKKKKEELMKNLQEDGLCNGVVKSIAKFGAFIDLGGIEGLLHIGDISWGHIKGVEDVLKVGEELELKILSFDKEKEKISLGLKQLTPHPWTHIETEYPIGSVVKGKVSNLTKFGAFVQLEEGVEGLIHISEMSWTEYVKHPSKIVSIGDIVEARVLDIDAKKQRISLGLKHLQPNPWEEVKDKYPVGTKIIGRVKRTTPFGTFVTLEEGIEGLVHVSDISWTKKIKHPKEVLKIGDKIEVVILSVNTEDEKISLGIKQIDQNPYLKYKVGNSVKVKVLRLTDFGAFVELEKGIEGLIHISQVSIQRVSDASSVLKVGEEIISKIIDIDLEKKRVDLSIKKYEQEQEEKSVRKYINQDSKKITLGEIVGDQLHELFSSFEEENKDGV